MRLAFLGVDHAKSHLYDGALVVVKVVDVDDFDLDAGVLEEKVQQQEFLHGESGERNIDFGKVFIFYKFAI